MRKFEAVVFDVDGTLLDTTEGVLAAVKYTIEKHGLKPLRLDQMLTFIGPPIQNSFMKYYGFNALEVQLLANTFREQYKTMDLLKAKPYKGIYELLDILLENDIKLAVATYKRQDYAVTLLKYFGFDKYTDILYGADDKNKLMKKDIIAKCMEDLGLLDYSRAVMVGDSENDAVGAHDIGMNFIGVTYGFGFHSKKDVMQHSNIGTAQKVEDILKLILMGQENENKNSEINSRFLG